VTTEFSSTNLVKMYYQISVPNFEPNFLIDKKNLELEL